MGTANYPNTCFSSPLANFMISLSSPSSFNISLAVHLLRCRKWPNNANKTSRMPNIFALKLPNAILGAGKQNLKIVKDT